MGHGERRGRGIREGPSVRAPEWALESQSATVVPYSWTVLLQTVPAQPKMKPSIAQPTDFKKRVVEKKYGPSWYISLGPCSTRPPPHPPATQTSDSPGVNVDFHP